MSRPTRFLKAACLACLFPFVAFSEAPVVDDSENFALLDEQQAAYERPVARSETIPSDRDEETALASDRTESTNTHANNNATLLDKFQGLQQELQELRGQLEVQVHELQLLKQQQLTFYKDLDTRLQQTPIKSAAITPIIAPVITNTTTKSATLPPTSKVLRTNPAEEQISYLAAYELIKSKRFDDAIPAMQAFVIKYPQGGYTDNAQYWLGELHLVKKNYPEAMVHFNVVLQQFPSSSKSAASLLKVGYAMAATGQTQSAIEHLQQVITAYPGTNTAQLARTKLESLTGAPAPSHGT